MRERKLVGLVITGYESGEGEERLLNNFHFIAERDEQFGHLMPEVAL